MFLRKLTLLAAVAACACSPALAAPKGATPAAFTPDRAYSGATPWTAARAWPVRACSNRR